MTYKILNKTYNKEPSEHVEQREFVAWFHRNYPDTMIFAIPNGGVRGKVAAQKLKLEGVKRGVWDLFIPEWMLFVEFKRQKSGSLSQEQKEFRAQLSDLYHFVVARGCDDAINQIHPNFSL